MAHKELKFDEDARRSLERGLERCSGAELVIGGSAGADLLPWESRVYRRPAATVELPVG